MKKTLLFIFLSIGLISFNSTNAQCTISLTAIDTVLCPGNSTTLTATPAPNVLPTTFAAGNNHRGNMFDIVAINEVMITGFDAHPMANTDIEIYYKVGTYAGSENNPAAWTLVGTAIGVVAQPLGTATPIPLAVNVTIPAGQTYSFYVTSSNVGVSLNYTNGTTPGAVFSSDANIQFLEGVGIEYPFSGGAFSPRVWNGNINYIIPGPTTYLWSTGDTTSSITVSPSVLTDYSVAMTASGCPTLIDTIAIDISSTTVDLGLDLVGCQGDTFAFDAMNAGSSFLWQDLSTGQTYSSSVSDTINVQVTDPWGCTANDTVLLTLNVNPVVSLGADTLVCASSGFMLDAGAGFTSYTWTNGDSTQTVSLSAADSIGVSVIDGNGCSGTDWINVSMHYTPTFVDTTNGLACYGDSDGSTIIWIDGGAPNYDILWASGDTTLSLTGLTAGTYNYNVSDTNGCIYANSITVTQPDSIAISAVTTNESGTGANGTIDLTTIGGTAGYSFSWDNGMTTEDISGLTAGTYVVTVTDTNGCTQTLSVNITSTVGMVEINNLDFEVFPNPSNGMLTLSVPNNGTEHYAIEVVNALSQVVFVKNIVTNTDSKVDLTHLRSGMYYLNIVSGQTVGTKRIIIQ